MIDDMSEVWTTIGFHLVSQCQVFVSVAIYLFCCIIVIGGKSTAFVVELHIFSLKNSESHDLPPSSLNLLSNCNFKVIKMKLTNFESKYTANPQFNVENDPENASELSKLTHHEKR